MSIGLRSREFVGDFTAWNLECLPCRVGIAPPTRCKYSHFSDQCSVCRCFFFGFILSSCFGHKNSQAAHAGGDCSKLIVENSISPSGLSLISGNIFQFVAVIRILLYFCGQKTNRMCSLLVRVIAGYDWFFVLDYSENSFLSSDFP